MRFDKKHIINLADRPELIDTAASWFHSKWSVPKQAYLDSMEASLKSISGVPQWYIIMDAAEVIIAGVGVIENDFHKRPDLTPNICALFVEDAHRRSGIAKTLLSHACEELAKNGITDTYLITGHTDFYERCGWAFHDMVEEDDGNMIRMYHRKNSC